MRRSKFSLSHYKLATMEMGKLIPISWFEALPGDSIQQSTSSLIRLSPMLAPVMHPVTVRIHHWFVPLRLLWQEWENFITGGPNGTSVPEPPYLNHLAVQPNTLQDYLGVPPGTMQGSNKVSVLPVRAYNYIWDRYYRDQDLVDRVSTLFTSGPDSGTSTELLNVAWSKDYFTSARPFEQKGDAVTIPIASDPVPCTPNSSTATPWFKDFGGTQRMNLWGYRDLNSAYYAPAPLSQGELAWSTAQPTDSGLEVDLSSVPGITINDLREALAVQRYREARANFGSRYVEYLRYLGVRSSDARLQDPEYLGGGRQTIQFSEVLDTAGYSGVVGAMSGHGIAAMRTARYRRFFEEHGIVMTLMSVVPKSIYSQSLHRSWSRFVKEDYFQKELQFIGDQPLTNREVYALSSAPDDLWGYQHRYDEYRTLPSTVSGEFRVLLNYWHLAREFTGDTPLNSSFVECVPTKRIFAEQSQHPLYVMANHSIQARRMLDRHPMPRTF